MNILVTGCMGFIGSNLCGKLLKEGHRVIGFDNLTHSSIDPTDRIKKTAGIEWVNFKFYKTDIRDLDNMISICRNELVDRIVHLAALGSVTRSMLDPSLVFDSNVTGFINVMRLAKYLNVDLVYASSSSVYGNSKEFLKREGHEGFPTSVYALSKLMNESFVEIWGKYAGQKAIGLRFFNVYGPGQVHDEKISAAIPQFITQKKPVVYGNHKIMRDFTYVDDVTEMISRAITFQIKESFVCNVGKGIGNTLEEVLTELGKGYDMAAGRTTDVATSVACMKRTRDIFRFVPVTSLRQGLKLTAEYYESINAIQK